MRPERDGIVRPLLTIGRADTTAVCKTARITPREDPTNRSLRFARNRIRHRVLPELTKLNPDISSAIARLADAASAVAGATATDAAAALAAATTEDAVDLDRLPRGEARNTALALWWESRTGERLASRHRAALERLAASTDGSRSLDLPGGRALREYRRLRVAALTEGPPKNGAIALERGRIAEWHDWRFALDMEMEANGAAHVARIDAEHVVVRARRPGDRMNGPRGAKVQDVFTDAKVPSRERDTWPLIAADDVVVWIPGVTTPPRTGRSALRALRMGDDSSGMTLGNRKQVASLVEERPRGEERGRART